LYICPGFAGKKIDLSADEIIELPKELFIKISLRENPDGYIALARAKKKNLSELKLSTYPLVIILEGLEKPGNIGAVMRTADAVKADAVLFCDERADFLSPNAVRASLGTVFSSQTAVCTSKEAIEWLKEKGIRIFSALPGAKLIYSDQDYKRPVAIAIGTEHEGLSEVWKKEAVPVKIPMRGRIDSLNASVSAAVILFEASRQRGFK
jgi:TrmH family RNA methyltransferase